MRNKMKLYEVPRKSKIRIIDEDVMTPPASIPQKQNDVLNFSHSDGMYSYCTDKDGNIVHISGKTKVKIVGQNNKKHEKQRNGKK